MTQTGLDGGNNIGNVNDGVGGGLDEDYARNALVDENDFMNTQHNAS